MIFKSRACSAVTSLSLRFRKFYTWFYKFTSCFEINQNIRTGNLRNRRYSSAWQLTQNGWSFDAALQHEVEQPVCRNHNVLMCLYPGKSTFGHTWRKHQLIVSSNDVATAEWWRSSWVSEGGFPQIQIHMKLHHKSQSTHILLWWTFFKRNRFERLWTLYLCSFSCSFFVHVSFCVAVSFAVLILNIYYFFIFFSRIIFTSF